MFRIEISSFVLIFDKNLLLFSSNLAPRTPGLFYPCIFFSNIRTASIKLMMAERIISIR